MPGLTPPTFDQRLIALPDHGQLTLCTLSTPARLPEGLVGQLDEATRARLDTTRNERRRVEIATSRWLLAESGVGGMVWHSLSHSASHIAVAGSDDVDIGVDVENRLPRNREAVADWLDWPDDSPDRQLQAWTPWEAWRKLERGSVLDTPDDTYREVLRNLEGIQHQVTPIAGAWWFSMDLDGAWVSLSMRRP